MEQTQITKIADNVKEFLERETKSSKKINELEGKISSMQGYFLRPDVNFIDDAEHKDAFNNFVRKGIETDLIKKSFSSNDGEGGALVTPSLQHKIISAMNAKSPMRQLASVERISTNALDVIFEEGNFSSGWVGETDNRVETNTSKLQKKTILVHELYAQPKATQRLIDDAEINIEGWLSDKLSDIFVRAENEAFITGDGDKKPFGLLTNNKIEKIDAGAKVTPEFLLEMINHLDQEYLAQASFLMNRTTLASIQGLKDNTDRFIWQQSLSDPLKQTIFGIPVVCSSHMPDIGKDNLAIALGDFKSGYKIVDRSSINIMRDPYTDKPFVKFYAVKRVGGDVVNPLAVKFAKFDA